MRARRSGLRGTLNHDSSLLRPAFAALALVDSVEGVGESFSIRLRRWRYDYRLCSSAPDHFGANTATLRIYIATKPGTAREISRACETSIYHCQCPHFKFEVLRLALQINDAVTWRRFEIEFWSGQYKSRLKCMAWSHKTQQRGDHHV